MERFLQVSQSRPEYTVQVLIKPLEGEINFLKPFLNLFRITTAEPIAAGLRFVGMSDLRCLSVEELAKHAAICVYNQIYDYSEDGLQLLEAESAQQFPTRINSGSTSVRKYIFEDWIINDIKPTAQSYDAATNNCIHFVKRCCDYLDVPFPTDLQIILDWLQEKGKSLIKAAQVSSATSSKSATSSANSCKQQ